MTTRAPFLSRPYGGYHHREVPSEDAELTHVGPGTPCGEYFRRFWVPVARSDDLKDLPQRIRILGEDLVIFRDGSGNTGLMELHCPHRGTSLEFGMVSEQGLRCCYHGWLIGVDGRILETPGEPADSTLKDRLCHGAYPTLDYEGLVFAYMGPPDKRPTFPKYDTFERADYHSWAGDSCTLPCNWLQVKENCMDPAHLLYLHTIGSEDPEAAQVTEDFAQMPEWEYLETPVGLMYLDTRRVGDKVWVRIADFLPPTLHQFPPSGVLFREGDFGGRPEMAIFATPIDDANTRLFWFNHTAEGLEAPEGLPFGQTSERRYEERQRMPGDYDAQSSQRPIARHALEHLGTTDRGIILLRNMVRRGIRAVQDGEDPKGVLREDAGVLPTYSRDTMVEMPTADTPEADRQLLRETAHKLAEELLNNWQAI